MKQFIVIFYLLLILIFPCFELKGQCFNFYKTYAVNLNLRPICLTQLKDCTYVFGGQVGLSNIPFIMRINQLGDSLWLKTFNFNQYGVFGLAELNDSNFICAGGFSNQIPWSIPLAVLIILVILCLLIITGIQYSVEQLHYINVATKDIFLVTMVNIIMKF